MPVYQNILDPSSDNRILPSPKQEYIAAIKNILIPTKSLVSIHFSNDNTDLPSTMTPTFPMAAPSTDIDNAIAIAMSTGTGDSSSASDSGSSGSLTSLGSLFSVPSSRSPSPELLESTNNSNAFKSSQQRWYARRTQDQIYTAVYETYKLRNSAHTIHSYYLSGLTINEGPRIEVVSAAFIEIRKQFNITTTEFRNIRDCTDIIFDANGRLSDTRYAELRETISVSMGKAESAHNRAARIDNMIFKPTSTAAASAALSSSASASASASAGINPDTDPTASQSSSK